MDASLANAIRRILLAEVATLAIEKVFVQNNTSVMVDEVLAHRLGLIPLTGSTAGLDWMKWWHPGDKELNIPESDRTDYNTIVLDLQIECKHNPSAAPDESDPSKKYINSNVYACDMNWSPMGQQKTKFADGPIRPANPDILITKLRPGQILDIVMHAHKGKGGDHAKFSPVATASYRLLPTIQILKPILGPDADKFEKCFPPGVIDVARVTATEAASSETAFHGREGEKKAEVVNPGRDTVSRECLRHDEFKDKVKLGRVMDPFHIQCREFGSVPE